MRQDIIIKPIPVKIFFKISEGNTYMHKISKQTGITYAHIDEIKNKFVKWGLVSMEKRGRITELNLTKKGRKILEMLKVLCKRVGEVN